MLKCVYKAKTSVKSCSNGSRAYLNDIGEGPYSFKPKKTL